MATPLHHSFCQHCGQLLRTPIETKQLNAKQTVSALCANCQLHGKTSQQKRFWLISILAVFLIFFSLLMAQSIQYATQHQPPRFARVQRSPQVPPHFTCGGISTQPNQNIDFQPYIRALQQQIRKAWKPPVQTKDLNVVAQFWVDCNGQVSGLHIKQSGNPEADEAALLAIQQAAPFAPLPTQFTHKLAPVEFVFDYQFLHSPTPKATPATTEKKK